MNTSRFNGFLILMALLALAGCGGGGNGDIVDSYNNTDVDDSSDNTDNGDDGSGTGELTAFSKPLYFVANDGTSGVNDAAQLWRTNGMADGTYKVSDPANGGDPAIREITPYGDQGVYFVANDGNGPQVWFSDGTQNNGEAVTDLTLVTDTRPENLTILGDELFFIANTQASGTELWKTNGTVAGTELVKDINEGVGDSNPLLLTVLDNQVYFFADDGTTGSQLWSSDGTEAGTGLVKVIRSGGLDAYGSGTEYFFGSGSKYFVEAGGYLYFNAIDDDGAYLWRTNGTEPGTTRVEGLEPLPVFGAGALTAVGDKVMFTTGNNVCVADGTVGGISCVDDWEMIMVTSDRPMAVLDGYVYFNARGDGSELGNEPWRSNGEVAEMVKDLRSGSAHSDPSDFLVVGEWMYFIADTEAGHENAIYRSDGSEAGTSLVYTKGIGGASFLVSADNGQDFIVALASFGGPQLHRVNNNELVRIKEICPSSCSEYIED